jgi:glutamate N-acetyltransferase/amino-acid N-acetyltransferase
MSDATQFLIPRGFRFGATKAGLKQSGRTDFALIVADTPASAAAAFTANRVTAAPLIVDKEHLRASGSKVRVVAINAGNANCAAGQAGLDAARATCAAAAEVFGCRPEEVFPSSTGVIGVPLPAEKLIAVLPSLAESLGGELDHFEQMAEAILTTDTVEKTAFARLEIGSREVRIAAACKGAGMIHPQLVPHATMLVYILTDALVEPGVLDGYLRPAIEVSFNRISVDGDTSTNDTVLLLASGASGAAIGAGNTEFAAALTQVCTSLARQIVADGEGISHVVELHSDGRRCAEDCQGDCALASCEDGVGGKRPQLGEADGGRGLLGRADRPRTHRHLVWRVAHLPEWRPGRGVRRGRGSCLHSPAGVHDHPRISPGSRRVHVLDHGFDGRVCAHQRGLLDLIDCNPRSGWTDRAAMTEAMPQGVKRLRKSARFQVKMRRMFVQG